MPTSKFCSACGASLPAARGSFALTVAHCAACAPRFRARRCFKVTSLLLLVVVAFVSGRYLAPQRTVYLIGTPIEPLATVEAASPATPGASSQSPETPVVNSTEEIVTVCGAPTRSGKPCQRKVKGGGYCWQHRDKYGQKNQPPGGR